MRYLKDLPGFDERADMALRMMIAAKLKVIAVHDHKGTLSILWSETPDPDSHELEIAQGIWDALGEDGSLTNHFGIHRADDLEENPSQFEPKYVGYGARWY